MEQFAKISHFQNRALNLRSLPSELTQNEQTTIWPGMVHLKISLLAKAFAVQVVEGTVGGLVIEVIFHAK